MGFDDATGLTIMDVGTGRQAQCFSLLKAKSIDHYDISQEHVAYFTKVKRPNITSTNCDLCNYELPENKYDIVYLAGIVHHFDDTGKGLYNCCKAVKINGLIWVYFYRSGTWKWLILSMVRKLITPSDIDNYFISSNLLYGEEKTSAIMDDFFAPHINLYTPSSYIRFMADLGFEVYSTSHADPLIDYSIDLAHHSAVIVFKKTKNTCANIPRHLTPNNVVDQISIANSKVYDSLDIFNKMISLKLPEPIKYNLCVALHRLACGQYYGRSELPPNYDKLRLIIEETYDGLKSL